MARLRSIKKSSIIILVLTLLIIALIFLVFGKDYSQGKKPAFGVTFSKKYAMELNLDWQQAYLAILDGLKVSNIRLIAYWDDIEKELDTFDFSELDWQIKMAADRGVGIMLSLGRRTPRWPECHDPVWLKDLNQEQIAEKQLNFVKEVVRRYKDISAIRYWQVENEPMVSVFGQCPKLDKKLLIREIEVVKILDQRPVVITDSGELGDWQRAAGLGDILGTTLYRIVWNKNLGFWDYYFVPPAFYHYKADITKFFHKNLKDVIITELQMEPWTFDRPMVQLSLAEQEQSFGLQRFKENINYAAKAGFPEIYLWGVEYWYWLDKKGYPAIWEEAKNLW